VAYSLQPSVRNSGTQAGLHLVEVQLTHVYGTEQIDGQGLELLCCFHQPGQDGVQINRKDPCGGPHAPPLRQARQDADEPLHRCRLAMKNRPLMRRHIPLAPAAVQLPPGATTGMAMRPQIVEPQPAAIVTGPLGANVHGGLHGTGTAMRERHGSGPYRRGQCGRRRRGPPQGAGWRVGEACKRCGRAGALAARRVGPGGRRRGRGAWAGPGEVPPAPHPPAAQDHELGIKERRTYGQAPTPGEETGALSQVFEPTHDPQRGGTRPAKQWCWLLSVSDQTPPSTASGPLGGELAVVDAGQQPRPEIGVARDVLGVFLALLLRRLEPLHQVVE
jgi:hypothetical protein